VLWKASATREATSRYASYSTLPLRAEPLVTCLAWAVSCLAPPAGAARL
jgi:hypothetical protein